MGSAVGCGVSGASSGVLCGGGVHCSEGLIVIFWGAFASASGVFVLAGV